MNNIGEKVKNERLKRHLTIRNLALKLGLVPSTISRIESGKTKPDFNTISLIANYYGVSTDFLLGRKIENEIEKEIDKLSDLGKEIMIMVSYFNKEDLLMVKGYMSKLNEKYLNKNTSNFG